MENKSSPSFADLICEYANERSPKYKFTADSNKFSNISVTLPIYGQNNLTWFMATTRDDKFYSRLPNDKFVWIDAYGEDSLHVIYKIMRLNIAKSIRQQYCFIKCGLGMRNRKEYLEWRKSF